MFDLNSTVIISFFLGALIGIAQKIGNFWLLLTSYLIGGAYLFVMLHQVISTLTDILTIGR